MIARRIYPAAFTALWLMPVLALLQTSVMSHFTVRGAVANIMLIAVVDWGILRGPDEGMLWAFVGGLCLDVFSGWPFGTSTVALVIVASIVSLGGGTFIRTHALLPVGAVFFATIMYYLIAMFILESTQHNVDWLTAVGGLVMPAALYNALLNVPGYSLMRRLEARIYPVARASW